MESIFEVLAEPNRRAILSLLLSSQQSVGEIERRLRMPQPLVSKHLRVLREVGLAEVRDEGRQRLYRLNAQPLEPIHEWVKQYERMWSQRFDRLDAVVQELKESDDGDDDHDQ